MTPTTESNVDANLDQLAKQASELASASLQSEESWRILNQFYRIGAAWIISTNTFILPVLNQQTTLRERLENPNGFFASFTTLCQDLFRFKDHLNTLAERHKGRSGVPSEEDHALILELSMDYHATLSEFENVIEPLQLELMRQLQKEVPDLVMDIEELGNDSPKKEDA